MKKPGKHIFGIPTVVARVPTDSQPATVVQFLPSSVLHVHRQEAEQSLSRCYGSNSPLATQSLMKSVGPGQCSSLTFAMDGRP